MARVLITGAGGFIGANLVRALLARGDEVHACVRTGSTPWRLTDIASSITLHEVDLASTTAFDFVPALAPELVYHLAHYGGNSGQSDDAQIRKVIIEGTAALYTACKQTPSVTAIIHTGSSSEYGSSSVAMREDMVAAPNTEYGLAKLWATLYGEHLRREHGLPITTLRLFSVYGPYEAPTRLFPAVIQAFLNGTTPSLSNPETVRDFVHVDDVVQALLHAPAAPHGIFNLGTGTQTSIKDVVTKLQTATGTSGEIAWGAMQGRSFDTPLWKADTTRMHEVFGFTPSISLEEGITQTVSWMKEHKDLYDTSH